MIEAIPLTNTERSMLDQLEGKIRTGIESTIKIGEALREIRDKRLYKYYGTFEDYCLNRWNFTSDYARKLINFVEVRQNVPVENERQARELGRLTSDEQKEIWGAVQQQMAKPLWEHAEVPEEEKQVWEESTPREQPTARQLVDSINSKMTERQKFEAMKIKEQEALRRKKCIENGKKSTEVTPGGSSAKKIREYVKRCKSYHWRYPDMADWLDEALDNYISVLESSNVFNS